MKTNKRVIGILAHVDAGKTTLSESLLYLCGAIKKLGRVDHKDAYLDTFELERARGITIFSKQAEFAIDETKYTLLDTPGHVDFSSEMERSLQVLDYAILVINGADGVQGHTMTLWKLLKSYRIPVFIFVNKMDQIGTQREKLLENLESRLSTSCIDFNMLGADRKQQEAFYDAIAMCDESLMDEFLDSGTIKKESLQKAIFSRSVFPVYFGSALKLEGVMELIDGMNAFTIDPDYPKEFGAKVFKITRDEQGNRLTHLKVTGGKLVVKDVLMEEKIDQIRIYSGHQFNMEKEVSAGTICALTGLTKTFSGQGLGIEPASDKPYLTPVLNYRIELPSHCDVHPTLIKLRQLEDEEPLLNIVWDDKSGEIHARVMGEIQMEILKSMILERFNIQVEFGTGSLIYRETINETVEGIGHFEPLRHYAEVHILMEPGKPGSGIYINSICSEDQLDRNWQRLILTHLGEKAHKGILTGSEITDIRLILVAGKAHQKHTEGGDFRQATYRAVRQGLRKAKNILLEPVYEYRLEVPSEAVGRAMSDISRMKGSFSDPIPEGEFMVLIGSAPVATMRDYHREVINYTKGTGRLFVSFKGYEPCHNAEEIMEQIGYDADTDAENPCGSVFCSHGAGFTVEWDQVEQFMHLESFIKPVKASEEIHDKPIIQDKSLSKYQTQQIREQELVDIFLKTYGPGKRETNPMYSPIYTPPQSTNVGSKGLSTTKMKQIKEEEKVVIVEQKQKEKYLLVDGYNIIFAWEELKELAQINLEAARMQLMDALCSYQSYKQITVMVIFDAYRVEGNRGDMQKYNNVFEVYTREAETADQYIERLVHSIGTKKDVTVATSDALEQMIIMGKGAKRLSANGLRQELIHSNEEIRSRFIDQEKQNINQPFRKLEL